MEFPFVSQHISPRCYSLCFYGRTIPATASSIQKLVVLCKLSNDVITEKQNAELPQDDSANEASNFSGLPSSRQFEDLLLDLENILRSGQTPFCKTFSIADLVRPEIIYTIDVPEVEMSE